MFHLRSDPYEQVNLYALEANAEKEEMIRAYRNWEREMIPPQWPAMINYRYKDKAGKVYWFEN
jgi:hypothetical protein